ncbi:ABC transporter substrate-binding protein [Mesorhizobium sp. M7A.F.Ca.US.006.01.1.1]|uniref:ABC transporter substrate-binding protein n=1 Tax=Mesorhizobium sp. M7A.F.Ca.US.006.01.1.1 TaxID=2496707 RepID=UPI001FE11C07|nr:ABC transporter substrate-binding protein [Mesorhizobium sp. M7A.F.Ca.US.006.01.1.1]
MPIRPKQDLHVETTGLTGFAKMSRRSVVALLAGTFLAGSMLVSNPVFAQDAKSTLVVAGPRTPESLDQEYPPTEAVHEVRRNVYERLLGYAAKEDGGIKYEDFSKLEGCLAESWDLAPDKKSITFHLRKGVKSNKGNELNADAVMWSFERGWNTKANFYWYMTQILKITSFEDSFKKVDDYAVSVSIPNPSPLLDRLWVNSDLGIVDAAELKKHVTDEDKWGGRWLSSNSASFGPYFVSKYSPGQEVIYEANPNYYRGEAKIKKVIFKEMPTSANRVAALQAGSVDVAEYLLPRELALLEKAPGVKIWKVFGNYIHRVEMNNTTKPFTDPKVRQALNYLVPRDDILKAVYFNTARPTKSPISEIYPGFTDEYFSYATDVAKAKALLAEAGYPDGFKTELGYRTGDQIEEELAVILKSAFSKAGVDVTLSKLPASTLVERYTKGEIPMYFFRDMAIVPDAAYVANLWLNSGSLIDYSRFKNDEVDKDINEGLTTTDEASRLEKMKRVQQITMENAPWVFLFNPGYQLATRANVGGFSWYTPNGNAWVDFSKQ